MTTMHDLEAHAERAKGAVEQRDRMIRLLNNADFRALIIEGFSRDECARFTNLSTEPGMSLQDRADALGSAQAAGHLKRWINAILRMGDQAFKDISDIEEQLEEMRAEDAQS